MIIKYLAACPIIFVIIFINEFIAEKFYIKALRQIGAHQVASLILIFIIAMILGVFTMISPIKRKYQAIVIGIFWGISVLASQYIINAYILKHDFLYMYDVFTGNLWLVVVLWAVICPYIFYNLQLKSKL